MAQLSKHYSLILVEGALSLRLSVRNELQLSGNIRKLEATDHHVLISWEEKSHSRDLELEVIIIFEVILIAWNQLGHSNSRIVLPA